MRSVILFCEWSDGCGRRICRANPHFRGYTPENLVTMRIICAAKYIVKLQIMDEKSPNRINDDG